MGERHGLDVVVVDDHGLVRSGLRTELAGRLHISGEAADVDSAVEVILRVRPAVVLLDVHLPGGGGVAVIERVRDVAPDVRFLALSASDAAADVVAVVHAGARGYVTKAVSAGELIDAVRRVAAGDAVFSPQLAGYVLDAFASIPLAQVDEDLASLTARERDVLRHVARGWTYKEIGSALHISDRTVETHVSSVLRKLQLADRRQLARWAEERGIR